MELRTNCKNCGASLHYDVTNYGKKVQCKYCRQEYHIDLLGRIEEYKVKLEFMGRVIDFYIRSFTVEPDTMEYSYIDDFRSTTRVLGTDITLELVGRI